MEVVVIFIFGLAVGSFLSATAWRLHRQESAKSKKSKQKYSITKGRSMCEHCGHTLAPKDLIPVLSWVSLGGKCRYCHKKLAWEYPVSELTTGILFALSYLSWEFIDWFDYVLFGAWLVVLSVLILLAIYDLKWLILPNKLVYPLIWLSVGLIVFEVIFMGGGVDFLRDRLLGMLSIGGTFYLLFQVSSGRWIGGGDVKLGVFIGLSLGLSRSVLAFIFAFNIAAIIVVPLLLLKIVKSKTPVPFGPFLILATIISTLYGYEIIIWYSDNFLYGLI